MNRLYVKQQLNHFFQEDIGSGDVTSDHIFDHVSPTGLGEFIAKQQGIFAGEVILEEAYHLFDEQIKVDLFKKDGQRVKKGDVIAQVSGPYPLLLTSERVILNLLQRLSGIATVTSQAIRHLANDQIKIADTRKTTPGLRMLEKYAVRCGGGVNHRFGLDDAVMLKDNHIAAVGSITKAVEKIRTSTGHMIKIEVEIENKEQLEEAIAAGVDVIMFDNMSPEQIRELIQLVPKDIMTEASGNITVDNIHLYKDTRVDIISLGFITHSAQALDISFNITGGVK
ncbi:carboxylating nicotinate-nucleotide diphosphorylase [Gracilibacillus thailandensis]|uniref:Probable nicotinate-nucleotide pyrophosphorylase [carboxylating] n=1 Tax=Gracilibacillus thailandensis TaxID=563735 RepID=A0A6N7R3E4_9BACI|nr:carboxylating nicotinate-nucleotide diphosphorylase [Gracilibacillus thailandensis]MRI67486.1 carboxylating nicotinate-nucleotide diphosphorylase [Gracilibacillus thailandensis]